MITITAASAFERLRAVGAPFYVSDGGITIFKSDHGEMVTRKFIPWQDSLGSLISRDAINAECIYYQCRRQG